MAETKEVGKINDVVTDVNEILASCSTKEIEEILSKLKLEHLGFDEESRNSSFDSNSGNDTEEIHTDKLEYSKSELEQKIIDYLTKNNINSDADAVKPLEIAKAIFGSSATKKKVNSKLYSLMNVGKVSKITEEDGKKPRWYLS